MKELSDRISNLSPEKRAILQKLLLKKKNGEPAFKTIPRRSERNLVPLSFAQERLWILSQLEPENPFYNLSWALGIGGPLDIPALEKSFAEITRRHESLRTTFETKDGMPVQKIAPASAVPLPVIRLEHMPKADQDAEVARRAAEEAEKPFDLTKGPLLRVTLLRLNPEAHVLLLTMHHIISDGWSMGIFIREMTALYEAFLKGEISPLPDLPIQYADFALWQRDHLSGEVLESHLAYWRKQLAGAPPVLELPSDRPRPAEQSFRGASEHFEISRALTERLKDLGKGIGATLFMTLLAAFATLLRRYTGQEDIPLGSPVANRNREETEPLIGFFVNTLVLRADLSDNPTFMELLARVKQTTLDAYSHQDMPFSRLVEALQPERDLSHTPLFQVMFVLQNMRLGRPEGAGVKVEVMETETAAAQFDLTLEMMETEAGLKGTLAYNKDLFDADRIRRMAGHFERLLQSIAANPDQRISESEILTDAERCQLLVEFNDTATDYPRDKTVVDLFEEQVGRTPDKIAVIFEDTKLSYRELNERANRVAHFLREEHGIRPDDRVGLLLGRSEWMIVGMLGILKSGGAYVPMDPAYPRERIRHMASDSAVKVILSEKGILAGDAKIADIRDIRPRVKTDDASNPESWARPHHLAYVIYTSGSTGLPKGVVIEHGNLYDYVMTFTEEFRVNSRDRFLQQTTVSFDASVEEIWPPLCKGAKVFVCRDARELDTLFSDVCRHRISILSLSPAAMGYFNTRAHELDGSLRVLISGGDVLLASSVDRLLGNADASHGKTEVYNTYGPTETTVCATYHKIGHLRNPTIPIGSPIANRRVHILDENLNPVPLGVPGEICIAGAGTARGYLNRDGLTAEKFLPDPFAHGERLYRTGDLGCWLPDGTIRFLGRNDDQVKIRGYRIESGEIEKCLLSHRNVREAVVISKDLGKNRGKELVAYISESGNPDVGILREHLKTMLPDYMIPSCFVRVEKMPLGPSGKIDKKALPDPSGTSMERGTAYVAPRNGTERRLANIWEEILGVGKVGIRDNFFDLGGHSLKAVQVTNRIREELGAEIALREIFNWPTVEKMAERIRRKDLYEPSSETPKAFTPLVLMSSNGVARSSCQNGVARSSCQNGEKSPLICVHPGDGNIFCYTELSQYVKSRPFYCLQAFGIEKDTSPLTSVEDMAERYVEALISVYSEGPYVLGGFCMGGAIAYEMAQQLSQKGEVVSKVILIDSFAPHTYSSTKDEIWDFMLFCHAVSGYSDRNIFPLYCEICGMDPDLSLDQVHDHLGMISYDDRLNLLWKCMRMAGISEMELGFEYMERIFRVYEKNIHAILNYTPRPYSGEVALFRASVHDPLVSESNYLLSAESVHDIGKGWRRYADTLTVFDIPDADHFGILRQPHVRTLNEKLNVLLEKIGKG